MNIPSKIRISGVDYKVLCLPNIVSGSDVFYGTIDYNENIIKIAYRGVSQEKQKITLLHELFHGIIESAQLDIDDEETVVEAFARGFYQIIADNENELFGNCKEFLETEENED